MPWWFSLLTTSRVPKRIENAASSAAMNIALSRKNEASDAGAPERTSKPKATAFNWSATYGRTPITAMPVISIAIGWCRP